MKCAECDCEISDVCSTRQVAGGVVRKRKCYNGHFFITEERVTAPGLWKRIERETSRARRAKKEAMSASH